MFNFPNPLNRKSKNPVSPERMESATPKAPVPEFDPNKMAEYERAAASDAEFASVFNEAQGIITAQEGGYVFDHANKPDQERTRIAVAYAAYLDRKSRAN